MAKRDHMGSKTSYGYGETTLRHHAGVTTEHHSKAAGHLMPKHGGSTSGHNPAGKDSLQADKHYSKPVSTMNSTSKHKSRTE